MKNTKDIELSGTGYSLKEVEKELEQYGHITISDTDWERLNNQIRKDLLEQVLPEKKCNTVIGYNNPDKETIETVARINLLSEGFNNCLEEIKEQVASKYGIKDNVCEECGSNGWVGETVDGKHLCQNCWSKTLSEDEIRNL
jgi:hypothetical protein